MNRDWHAEPAVEVGAQRLLMAAGYEPKGDWVYIDDLVQAFRNRYAGRDDLLAELDQLLGSINCKVTRDRFAAFQAKLKQREQLLRSAQQQQARLDAVYSEANIPEPGPGHEALALRVVALENAVRSYAERLKSAEAEAVTRKGSSCTFPFLAGVLIGGLAF